MPWGVSFSPDGARLYVTHVGLRDHDNVWRYDRTTLEVKAAAKFPGHAVESVSTADGKTLYVSNSRKDELLALDAETLAVTARFATGRIPKDFRLSPDERRIYVADYGGGTLTVIDVGGGETRQVKVGKHPRGVALSPDGATAWVTNMGSKTVSVVDTATLKVTTTVKVPSTPRHAVVTGDGRFVLVTCFGGREVVVLDAATGEIARRVKVGKGPKTVVITRDGKVALTADERGGTVTLIDLATWDALTVDVGEKQPIGLAVAPDDSRVALTARGSDRLLLIERR